MVKKKTLKVPIFVFKPKSFQRRYGKRTKAVTESCSPRKRECEIHIKSGLTKSDFKYTLMHEMGHIITERARIASRISQIERKRLRELAKTTLPKRKFVHKRERIREMLAIIYEKLKQRNKAQTKVISKEVPQTKRLIEEAIRRIKIKREIIRLKNKIEAHKKT